MPMPTVRASVLLCAVLAVAAGSPAVAQTTKKPATSTVSQDQDDSKLFGIGFATLQDHGEGSKGLQADLRVLNLRPTKWGNLSLVGALGLDHYQGTNFPSFMGGLRITRITSKIKPYGQILLGGQYCAYCGSFPNFGGHTYIAIEPDIGLDYPVNPKINFRAAIGLRILTDDKDKGHSHLWFGVSMPVFK